MVMFGADAAGLDSLASLLDQKARELERMHRLLGRQLHAAPWRGAGADRFRSKWSTVHGKQVADAVGFLRQASKVMADNAHQQREASAARTGVPVAGLPGGPGTKGSKKFDIVKDKGDDRRDVYLPRNPNGKTLYFFFGYTGDSGDQDMLRQEEEAMMQQARDAAAKGFKVVLDRGGTLREMQDALYDQDTAGFYWSGHGWADSDIQDSNGTRIGPGDFDPAKVSPALAFFVLATCNSGVNAKGWKNILPDSSKFQGWKDTTTPDETNDFMDTRGGFFGWMDDWSSHNGMLDDEMSDFVEDADNGTSSDRRMWAPGDFPVQGGHRDVVV